MNELLSLGSSGAYPVSGRELQKEIDELIADEEARLRVNERDKQRDEINAEIDAVNDKYDKLTSEENLR